MSKLKSEPFNQLIIVVEYRRASVDFYNHLEILERCLNGVVDSSVMLIINKTPNKVKLRKALKENPNFNLEQNLKHLIDEIARIFKFRFSTEFSFIEELEDEEDERKNDIVLDKIRNVINMSESFDFSNAKTWSDLEKIVEDSKKANQDQTLLNAQVKSDLKDQINKIDLNIDSLEIKIDWLTIGHTVVEGAEMVANFTKYKFLTPLINSGNTKLRDYIEEQKSELSKLNEEKARKEERLITLRKKNASVKCIF